MKNWTKPEAIGQEFAANDYVSVCTITVKCDFWPSDAPTCENGGPHMTYLNVPDTEMGYSPCGDEYEHDVNVNALKPVTFDSGYKSTLYPSSFFTVGPATGYYWFDEEGDYHVSSITAAEIAEANKS